ncbi:hypothetical protein [Flavonifractor sp. An306]|uniref:hypothetical protein n=1 Tax=Flavonifractor sp. An306 TaxID=1965629 RepID=UPI0013A686EB|nr:hypothetical protein [Flavonifractor sp. An306]
MTKPREKTREEMTAAGMRNFNKLSGFPTNRRDFSISLEITTYLKKEYLCL